MSADLGSISHGTMRNEDLIPAFADTLEYCAKAAAPHPGAINPDDMAIVREANEWDSEADDAAETGDGILEDLFDALQAYAPDYAYFGAHPGDGSDYGFWLYEDFQQCFRDNGGLEVTDTSDVPADYSGEVLHVNDHGNCTLYNADPARGPDKHLIEVWSVV